MDTFYILGIRSSDRISQSGVVQQILTEYGCNIRTRLGLHHVSENVCSINGLILLELCGDMAVCEELASKLSAVNGLEVQKMIFQK
ncbi:MAG: hypothetical protein Q4C96_01440 [Planctomycetia bacterium]|nr:hypothetical protein [Planctomycetia bacterium]